MWIVRVALNRPYTFIVFALVIILITPFVLQHTAIDIFPDINIPVISVGWNYTGLSPEQMEDRIVSNYERFLTTAVDSIEHIESQTVAGRSVIKIFFQPGANVPMALTQVTATSQSIIRSLPPGIAAPLIITYSASAVPIVQLGMKGEGLSEQELFDYAANLVRNQMATVPGTSIPWPYGGKQRQVSVNVDIPALQAKGLSPVDVINAVSSQNLALPSGSVKLGPTEYNVEMNGSTEHHRRPQRSAAQDRQRLDHLRPRRRARQRRLLSADQYRAHGRPARRAGDGLQDGKRFHPGHCLPDLCQAAADCLASAAASW